jgi:transcription antitermination factor NusG
MSGRGWIVARTKPGREAWAAENVARQGYTYYFPRILAQRKRLARAEPLFHCYLFVQTSGAWKFLLSTFGVSGVVIFGETPSYLPQTEIDKFRALEVDGLVQLPKIDLSTQRFKPGQEVRVRGGVFSGFAGVYQGQDAREREKVLIDFLGRKTLVLLAPDIVEAAA